MPKNPLSPRPPASKADRSSEQNFSSAPGPVSASALVPAGARPLTLETLDAMPAAPARHATLHDMAIDDLGAMARGLDGAREKYESLSGTCATLAGLVLIEAKKRLDHGKYLPWVKKHLGKSNETASQYVAVAKAFVKFQPKLKFEQLTLALMDGMNSLEGQSLDLTHPTVNAVSAWAKGRTFYQLKQEEIAAGADRGGDTSKKAKKLTPEEEHERMVANLREDSTVPFHGIETMGEAWKILTDAEIETRIEIAAAWIATAQAWLKTPKSKRPVLDVVQAALHHDEASPTSDI